MLVRLLDRAGHRGSAGVRVLDDHAGGAGQLLQQRPRCGEVVQVVVRERLALELFDSGEQMALLSYARIESGTLVRVLPVREVGDLLERKRNA